MDVVRIILFMKNIYLKKLFVLDDYYQVMKGKAPFEIHVFIEMYFLNYIKKDEEAKEIETGR